MPRVNQTEIGKPLNPDQPEKIRHHWTAGELRDMEHARQNLSEMGVAIRENGDWQIWANNLVKHDIPALRKLLVLYQESLTRQQEHEISELIRIIEESVSKQNDSIRE